VRIVPLIGAGSRADLERQDVAVLVRHERVELDACRAIAARKRELVEIGAIAHRASYAARPAALQIEQDYAGACGELATAQLLLGTVGPTLVAAFQTARARGRGDSGADLRIGGVRIQVKTAAAARQEDLALWLPPHFEATTCDLVVLAWRRADSPDEETIVWGWTLAEHIGAKGAAVSSRFGPVFKVPAVHLSAASWLRPMVARLGTGAA
jgi:hypothetical protein